MNHTSMWKALFTWSRVGSSMNELPEKAGTLLVLVEDVTKGSPANGDTGTAKKMFTDNYCFVKPIQK